MQIGINEIKNGLGIDLEGEPYYIIGYEHVKPGKGAAFARIKLKKISDGTVIERTFKTSDRLEVAFIEKKNFQYLYSDGEIYQFMDHETYDQISLRKEQLGEVINYLKENLEVTALMYKNRVIILEPPIFIDLKVIHTERGVRGDTSKSGSKPATLETGLVISVPLFINEGETIRIDTRTKEYIGRI